MVVVEGGVVVGGLDVVAGGAVVLGAALVVVGAVTGGGAVVVGLGELAQPVSIRPTSKRTVNVDINLFIYKPPYIIQAAVDKYSSSRVSGLCYPAIE